jgi:hypothetical protein
MMAYARGSKALGVCDKTGFTYLLKDLVFEYVNGQRTGFKVGRDVADPDHPQNFLGQLKINDPQSLFQPRPDSNRDEGNALWGWRPVGHPSVLMTAGVGTVTVTT